MIKFHNLIIIKKINKNKNKYVKIFINNKQNKINKIKLIMKINENQIKTNIYLDSFNTDKRIIPLFRTPIILKKIEQLKKSKDNKSTVIQKKLTFKIIPLNQKLVKYSNIIDRYKIRINQLILRNIKAEHKIINNSKFIFLENNDLSKLKIFLNKILWPLYSLPAVKPTSAAPSEPPLALRSSSARGGQHHTKKNRGSEAPCSASLVGMEWRERSITGSVSTAPLHNLDEDKFGTGTSYFNNLYQAFSYKPINLTYLNSPININIKGEAYLKENNLKKIIEIRNLLVILNKMQNHIKLLISLRRKLIFKKKIKIIKKILVEEAIKLQKEKLQKKIEIFNITKEKNKYIPFPAKDSFYQNEILIFKEDIESMLANSFDLFVLIKNDLSFDQIMVADPSEASMASEASVRSGDETKNNLILQPNNNSFSFSLDKKKALSAPQKLYFKYISKPHSSFGPNDAPFGNGAVLPSVEKNQKSKLLQQSLLSMKTNTIENGKHSIDRTQNKGSASHPSSKGMVPRRVAETYFNWPLGIKHAIEENKKKMVVTLKGMIYKHKKFDSEISIVENRTPVNLIFYSKNNNTIISQYLKSMSIFNMIKKGTFIYFSSCIGYFFKYKNYKKFKNIYKLLFYFFKTMFCLISKPVFIHKSDKIIIQLYYFLILPNFFKDKLLRRNFRYKKLMKKFKKGEIKRRPYKYIANFKTKKRVWKFNKLKLKLKILLKKASNVSLVNLYPKKFKIICNVLSKAFNKNIELNLIRLHYPYKDSNILANLLALLVNKIKLRRITRKLFKYAVIKNLKNIVFDKANYIPAYLTGMTIKIGGRLMKYKVVPKKTSQKVQKGSSSFGKVNFTDFARYTSKNRRGAFSITVSSGHNFF